MQPFHEGHITEDRRRTKANHQAGIKPTTSCDVRSTAMLLPLPQKTLLLIPGQSERVWRSGSDWSAWTWRPWSQPRGRSWRRGRRGSLWWRSARRRCKPPTRRPGPGLRRRLTTLRCCDGVARTPARRPWSTRTSGNRTRIRTTAFSKRSKITEQQLQPRGRVYAQ